MKTVIFHCERDPQAYEAICRYAGLRIWSADRGFGPGSALAIIDDDGRPSCAIIYHNYDDEAGIIEYSGAGDNPRWLTRDVMFKMFDYPFNNVGVQAVFTRTDGTNKKLHRIYEWYGFTVHEVPHMRGRNKSEFVYVLTHDAWVNNGKHKDKHNVEA